MQAQAEGRDAEDRKEWRSLLNWDGWGNNRMPEVNAAANASLPKSNGGGAPRSRADGACEAPPHEDGDRQ